MKNILIVLGGGRPHGNTQRLADAFRAGATDAGHSVKTVSLNRLEVRGCLGCNACRYGKPCVQNDDFNGLISEIKGADLIVFCLSAEILDYFCAAKGIHRTVLLYRRI